MQGVGPRLDSDVYNRAGLPAILRFGIFLEIELLDRINGQNCRAIGEWTGHVGYRACIKKVSVDHTVYEPNRLVRAGSVSALGPWSSARVELNPGAQTQQVLVIPAVQR